MCYVPIYSIYYADQPVFGIRQQKLNLQLKKWVQIEVVTANDFNPNN